MQAHRPRRDQQSGSRRAHARTNGKPLGSASAWLNCNAAAKIVARWPMVHCSGRVLRTASSHLEGAFALARAGLDDFKLERPIDANFHPHRPKVRSFVRSYVFLHRCPIMRRHRSIISGGGERGGVRGGGDDCRRACSHRVFSSRRSPGVMLQSRQRIKYIMAIRLGIRSRLIGASTCPPRQRDNCYRVRRNDRMAACR